MFQGKIQIGPQKVVRNESLSVAEGKTGACRDDGFNNHPSQQLVQESKTTGSSLGAKVCTISFFFFYNSNNIQY